MAIEQDLIIKIKAVLDQNVQNTIKQLNSTITKGVGGKGGVFGDTKDIVNYAKQMKSITGEIKLTGREMDQLKRRREELVKQLEREVKLQERLREGIEKAAEGSEREAVNRERMLKSLERQKNIQRDMEIMPGSAGGGGGRGPGRMAGILGAMGGGLTKAAGITAGAFTLYDELFATGAQRRATARAAPSNDYISAVMSGRISAGMVRSSPRELRAATSRAEAATRADVAQNLGGGIAAGAAMGAAAGSILPGLGTAVGAGVGAIGGGIVGLGRGLLKKNEYFTQNLRENIQLREEELQPLMEMTERYQARQMNRFNFMRQTGLSEMERPMFRAGGITDQMRQYGLTEAESMGAIGGVAGVAGSQLAVDAARGGTLGKLVSAGFGDQAGRGIAQSAFVGGNNVDAARRYAQLVGSAFATSFGDTPTAKALTEAGQAIEKQAAGQFGRIGDKTSQDFMSLASMLFQQYGGQSVANVQRAQALQQSIVEGSRTTSGVGGLYNISAGAKAGMGLAGQRGLAALSLSEIGDPQAERSKLGYELTDQERQTARKEKAKAVTASQLGFGIDRTDISKEIFGKVSDISKLPQDEQQRALNDLRSDIRKRADRREGKVTALGAGGNFEEALQLTMATAVQAAGIKGTVGEDAAKELDARAAAGMGTEAARTKMREVETERTDIRASETAEFRNKINQIEDDSKKAIESTFKLLREKLMDLERQAADMQVKPNQ